MTPPEVGGDDTTTTEGTPTVSVVVIFLNQVRYLEEAVASILAQRDVEVEVLLVDDGSTDGSTELAQRLADEHPGQVVSLDHPGHANLGMAPSRERGFAEARAPWLALLDGDDVWEPDHLAGYLAAAEHHGVDLVVGPALRWRSWALHAGVEAGGGRADDDLAALALATDEVLPPKALLDACTFDGHPIPTNGLLFRRHLVPLGGFAEAGLLNMFEDQVMIAKLTVQTTAVAVPQVTARYRQRIDSAVHTAPGRGGRDPVTRTYLRFIRQFLDNHLGANPERLMRLDKAEARARQTPTFWAWWAFRWTAYKLVPPAHRGHPQIRRVRRALRRLSRRSRA